MNKCGRNGVKLKNRDQKIYVRRPGIEPGTIAWKATMLTTTPPTLLTLHFLMRFSFGKAVFLICDFFGLFILPHFKTLYLTCTLNLVKCVNIFPHFRRSKFRDGVATFAKIQIVRRFHCY